MGGSPEPSLCSLFLSVLKHYFGGLLAVKLGIGYETADEKAEPWPPKWDGKHDSIATCVSWQLMNDICLLLSSTQSIFLQCCHQLGQKPTASKLSVLVPIYFQRQFSMTHQSFESHWFMWHKCFRVESFIYLILDIKHCFGDSLKWQWCHWCSWWESTYTKRPILRYESFSINNFVTFYCLAFTFVMSAENCMEEKSNI